MGGSGPHEGCVQVYQNDVWGTVCDNGWDLQDATVVCHELDYGKALRVVGNAAFRGPGKWSNLVQQCALQWP